MVRAFLCALVAFILFAGTPAMAIEEPRFTIEAKEGAFEVRRYAPQLVAEVTVRGSREGAANAGFQPLANFIFGANAPRAKIAMTAPVTQTRAGGEKIAMTAPVSQTPASSGDADTWIVRFAMPAQYTLETLPRPTDPAVRIVEEAPRRMAAVRFSGGAGERALRERTADLEAFLAARGEAPAGPATYAFYDPPWTPPFLRRNEVLIPLRPRAD